MRLSCIAVSYTHLDVYKRQTVLDVIHGPDGHDTSVPAHAADWTSSLLGPNDGWKSLRIGYLKSEFDPPEAFKPEPPKPNESADDEKKRATRNDAARDARARSDYDRRFLLATLDKIRALGVNLIPVELPALPLSLIHI